jgi:hypothetical protein
VTALSRAILFLAGLGGIGVEALCLLKLRHHGLTPWGMAAAFLAPLLIGIAFIHLSLRLPAHRARRLVLEFILLGLSVPVVEAGLTAFAWNSPSAQLQRFSVAEKLGIPFDHRYKSQVVDAMRAQGTEAYPGLPRDLLWQQDIRQQAGSALYPLSQVANSPIVDCNESGQYLIYRTDEYGFNNPPGLYDSGHIDIAAIGSSYTLGYCVPPGRGFMSLLQARYPRTLNFGIAGSHVPTMYATLREYIAPLHPPILLWVMYPSAIESYELEHPIIRGYLDADFSQHLLERRAQVDGFLRQQLTPVQWQLDRKSAQSIADADYRRWRDIARLPLLRDKLTPLVRGTLLTPPPPNDWHDSMELIARAKQLVEGWGGHMVVVLIPVFGEVVNNQYAASQSTGHILELLEPLHLHVINGVAYFREQRDPTMLYTMGMSNHFNVDGHRLFADYIDADLRATYPDLMTAASKRE